MMRFELNNIKQQIKPFAIVSLKDKKVEYSTLKKTTITDIHSTNKFDFGDIYFTLNQRPIFLKVDFNGIDIGNFATNSNEVIEKNGEYIVHLKYTNGIFLDC